uniref:Uncharacterized protein n=1 Tax=Bactrocera dorsalis TaxID=27457 RepID=A0A034WW96_BACDO
MQPSNKLVLDGAWTKQLNVQTTAAEESEVNKTFIETIKTNMCSFERLAGVGESYSPTTNTTYQTTNNIIDLNSYYAYYTNNLNYGYICEISPKSTIEAGTHSAETESIQHNVPHLEWTFRPNRQEAVEERNSGIYEEVNIADFYATDTVHNNPSQDTDINSLSYKYASNRTVASTAVNCNDSCKATVSKRSNNSSNVTCSANVNVNANVNCNNVSSMQNAKNICKLNATHEIAEDNNYAMILSSCKPLKFSFASEWLV